ncbi:MAG: reverse gyrase [Candidatus Methanomethylicota archaeon]|nr:MAG: reverse gyrase [Candidatus Verstraetearchaeota archaeon]
MQQEVYAIFRKQCPNCGGDISNLRLELKIPCEKCIPIPDKELLQSLPLNNVRETRRRILELLKKNGTLNRYNRILEVEEKVDRLNDLFEKISGSTLWSAQRTWCKRAFEGKSFSIIAPTGMGKTVFGIMLSLYIAMEKKRAYIILPTTLLAQQVHEKIEEYKSKLDLKIKIKAYYTSIAASRKKDILKQIFEENYQILVTTSNFLSRYYEKMRDRRFDLIFVDDVDSFMKTSRNVEKVLKLLGLDQEIIELGYEAINLRRKIKRIYGRRRLNKKELENLNKKLENIRKRIEDYKRKNKIGVLIVSGASIRARRTRRIQLFRELLGFEIGGRMEGIRNVEDMYIMAKKGNIAKHVLKLVKKLGSGGLIFTPMDKGREYMKKITEELEKNGIKVESVERPRRKLLMKFRKGEYDILVGMASYRSPLARGIDLPERVRYAIFAGVPKIKIALNIDEFNPFKAIALLANLRDFTKRKSERIKIDNKIIELRRYSWMINEKQWEMIREAIEKKVKLEGFLGKMQRIVEETVNLIKNMLKREDVRKGIKKSSYLDIEEGEKVSIIIPDIVGYLQGSGRTSRLYAGGISKGIAIIIVDNVKAFNGLKRGLKWYLEDVSFSRVNEKRIKETMKKVDEDREKIRRMRRGEITGKTKETVKTALLIVESPNKARTIARFFGVPQRREINGVTIFEVSTGEYILNIASSRGHIFDLVTDEGYHGVATIYGKLVPIYGTIKKCKKCHQQYTDDVKKCPLCGGPLENRGKMLDVLKRIAGEVDYLLIGTDADSEGEKIGWDLSVILSPYTKNIRRIYFHEVTQRALRRALQTPTGLNIKLVESQILRRIEDRWIGFELSGKVQRKFNRRDLSAGRVQTPVLGWIVKRMKESKKEIMELFEITLENGLKIILRMEKMPKKKIREILNEIRRSKINIIEVEKLEVERKPPPPFSTDTMLEEASRKLKFSIKETMQLAQDLFEAGLITYHRTDSIKVSAIGVKIAQEYIVEKWGKENFKPRVWSREGAHECIRPTRGVDADRLRSLLALGTLRLPKKLTGRHIALYNLIFNRFIASQMKKAKVLREKVKVEVMNMKIEVENDVEVLDAGFTLILPIKLSQKTKPGKMNIREIKHWRITGKPLFSEGDIIRMMKKRRIGRPSTYSKIISTLLDKRYVIMSPRKKKLIATRLGEEIYKYLNQTFKKYVSEETTRKLEKMMDDVENGKLDYITILQDLNEQLRKISESFKTTS